MLFPFVGYLAVITSAVLLVALGAQGGVRLGPLVVLGGWCLAAAWCQFFVASATAGAVGLGAKTVLAIGLVMRWRFSS